MYGRKYTQNPVMKQSWDVRFQGLFFMEFGY